MKSAPVWAVGLAFVGLISVASQGASAAPSEVGWVIEQKSEERGQTMIKVTESSMVLTSKLMSAILKAPNFDAWFFNESTKKYVLMPRSNWAKRYAPGKRHEGTISRRKGCRIPARRNTHGRPKIGISQSSCGSPKSCL